MSNLSSVDLVLAKQVAADVRVGLAPREALLDFKALAIHPDFSAYLERLDPGLLRFLNLARKGLISSTPLPHTPKGKRHTLFLPPLPGEAQLRVAYEVVLEAFLEHLEAQGLAVLERGEGVVVLYVPRALELEEEWRRFLNQYLGLEGFFSSLGLLLESSRLAPRGFSVPKTPLVTEGMRLFLAGWYLASLEAVKERLKWREREIEAKLGAEDPKERKEAETLQRKQEEEFKKYGGKLRQALEALLKEQEKVKTARTKLEKRIERARHKDRAKLEKRLANLRPPLGPGLEALVRDALQKPGDVEPFGLLDRVLETHPLGKGLRGVAARFGQTARGQLATAVGNKFARVYVELLRLLDVSLPEAQLPPLFRPDPFGLEARAPGDKAEACYGCGQPMEEGYKASKLIFASPSQRLQSGYGQEEPKVCAACAVVGLASPLKVGEGNVLVRVRAPLTHLEEAKAFARMVALGSLNVAAGPYIQLNSPLVQSGGKRVPLAQAVGRLVYALAYIGCEVDPNVLRRLTLELLEGGQSIRLPAPALWLSHLYQLGFGSRLSERGEANRDLAEALRYALAGLPWHGEYVLARRYGRVVDPVFLEAGRRDYAALLAEGGEGMGKLAERFRDVAGLAGILYAWAYYVKQEASKKGLDPKREITKLLENLESPYFASYVASYALNAIQASLYRNPQQAFLYEEALRLLQEAGVPPREEEGRLLVSQDELWKAYSYLAEKYGNGDGEAAGKSWKDFIYEVRLALASRFPEYIRAEREG